ncbi:hypothetical protein pb186bvf_018091 [Paramecium bursaria]
MRVTLIAHPIRIAVRNFNAFHIGVMMSMNQFADIRHSSMINHLKDIYEHILFLRFQWDSLILQVWEEK